MARQKRLTPQIQGRIHQADYAIIDRTNECRICLTQGQIDWILSQADYAGWPTRWKAAEYAEINAELINAFKNDLISRLIMACVPCLGEDEVYELRQSPENPCQLEQSLDGGLTWTLAFDYRLCLFNETLNPPDVRIDPATGNVQYSIDDGVTWVDAPKPSDKTPLKTNIYEGNTDEACHHAANATELIRKMVMDTGDDLLILIDAIVNILLVIITGGATLPLLVTNLITAVLAFGLGAIRDSMVASEWDKLRCILFCSHDASWGWTPLGWDDALDQIGAQFPPGVAFFLGGLIQTMGSIGLTNAGYLPLVDTVDCSDCQCGDLDCGFTTTASLNRALWSTAIDLFDPVVFDRPIGFDKTASDAAFKAAGNQILAGFTTFEEACYITDVTLYTLGRPYQSYVSVGYKTTSGGDWHYLPYQTYASWAAGVGKVFTINASVVAIQIQSKSTSASQQDISTVVIGDPTP